MYHARSAPGGYHAIKSGLICLFNRIPRRKPTAGELHLCFHVTDGDTIKVIFRGQTEKLRILDIDAPEVRRPDKLRKQAVKAGLSENAMLERGQEAKRVLPFEGLAEPLVVSA